MIKLDVSAKTFWIIGVKGILRFGRVRHFYDTFGGCSKREHICVKNLKRRMSWPY